MLPNRLSYPELVPQKSRYDSLEDAVAMIVSMADTCIREQNASLARHSIEKYQMEMTVRQLDEVIERLVDIS